MESDKWYFTYITAFPIWMPATYEMLKFEKQNKRGEAKYNEAFYFHSEWNIMVVHFCATGRG